MMVLIPHIGFVVQTAISALQSVLQEDFKATEIEVRCLPFIHSAVSDTRPLKLNDRRMSQKIIIMQRILVLNILQRQILKK